MTSHPWIIEEVQIDTQTLAEATALERAEWRVLAEDLRAAKLSARVEATVLVVARAGKLGALRLESACGVAASVEITSSTLSSLVDEYTGIVRAMMAEDVPLPRLEALDMAKKVVHDRAARTLRAEVTALDGDAEAMRRLFSLLVAMRVDPREIRATRRHL